MRVLFWGTPTYAVPTLDALNDAGYEVVGVVSQPDRRRGRGNQQIASPVKQRALELGIRVFTPERIRNDIVVQAELASLKADISVVVAFGQLLPSAVLKQPPLGCWNGHASLLPRWRGAGPIQWSLLSGDNVTGVGIMAMEEGLDTGPVLVQERVSIALLENATALANRLSSITAKLFLESMPRIAAAGPGVESERWKQLEVIKQEEIGANPTYAQMLSKKDYILDWNQSAMELHRRVMGLYPNALSSWNNKRLKVQATEPLEEGLKSKLSEKVRPLLGRWQDGKHAPGKILSCEPNLGLVVSTKTCPVLIQQAQLEGKSKATGQVLIQQLQASVGDYIGKDGNI
ncbi:MULTISPECIES: methionyl-tRNA formyltransferase [unclassified Prochlorococcus]|uniref:methionyl-tRNA formyltransferase n=1 Tax=unclassified Prochlorococcus TaxID=2627481 RepID=UPI000533AABC|nr:MULTISPECIES: methionyl-tRNA formyltransferase [unclassified Prochlorococcus]KGG24680.1 Methionyl-tRNA formyltransferase [Prochlorococcus sp. MIT 0701]KGG30012.1 Methionyl-tRNA formyltransferase [Prochlorococcus sp. MIT 0702]KGG30994.1 Methionyl-tRNA formyltransferase [Prochlorococcus sp. MIT 0703]